MQAHPQLKFEGDLLIRPLHLPDGLHLPIETYLPDGVRFPEQIGSSGSKNEVSSSKKAHPCSLLYVSFS